MKKLLLALIVIASPAFAQQQRSALPAADIKLLPGFKAELIRNAEPNEGSWIAMTVDPKGRLIISPQDTNGLLRVTLTAQGQVEKVERIPKVGIGMGLLYAFDSLYVVGWGPQSVNGGDIGLYRLKDTDGDDQFDEIKLLKKFQGGAGEHGSHAIVLSPDQKSLYVMHGNFVKVMQDISPQSPHKNYAEDQLLPRAEDGNGFGVGIKPPGGFLTETDPDGKQWKLVAAGLRNTYDFDFNQDGEMFGFDSDMEWDIGMPWYRPTRVVHLVSGGDYGFREGSGKWPTYYPDSLPPVVDIGLGSPTGVKFGTKAKFPAKYRKALFAMDWTHGRILAVHLQPKGASYTGTFENFALGKPLPVTDLEIGKDGALYFTIGGRGNQSGLYRVTYTGSEPTGSEPGPDTTFQKDRQLRKQLEKFHGRKDPQALATAWDHLDHSDRWIRYAARIAIESQEFSSWRDKALSETRPNAALTALLAFARYATPDLQPAFFGALSQVGAKPLNEEQTLEALRVLGLGFVRMGAADADTKRDAFSAIGQLYPSESEKINRELSKMMIYLDAPGTVKKTMGLLAAAPSQEEQIHYVFHLRNLKTDWTMEDRQLYFGWFHYDRKNLAHEPKPWFEQVDREYADGASVPKFIAKLKSDAIASLNEKDRAALAPIITGQIVVAPPAPPLKKRPFVKEWTMNDLVPHLPKVAKGRNFEKGKEVFTAAQCFQCHRFATGGGSVGPDITAASSRFNRRDLLETIVEPSKIVSDQYQNTVIVTKDDSEVEGRLIEETDQKLVVITNPLTQEKREIQKTNVARRAPSKISSMPEGLINTFTLEEILDLLAYIEAGGKSDTTHFKP